MTTALEGGEVSASHPAAFYPGKDPVPIVQKTGWAPGPVWTGAENIPSPPGFDPRTVQPVASHYTDWAIYLVCIPFIALFSLFIKLQFVSHREHFRSLLQRQMVHVAYFEIIAVSFNNHTEQINRASLNVYFAIVKSVSTQGYSRRQPSVNRTMEWLQASVSLHVVLSPDQPDCDAAN